MPNKYTDVGRDKLIERILELEKDGKEIRIKSVRALIDVAETALLLSRQFVSPNDCEIVILTGIYDAIEKIRFARNTLNESEE